MVILYWAAVLVLASSVSCSSPTAASSSIWQWTTAYPGCSPIRPFPPVSGEPTIVLQDPANDALKVGYWPLTQTGGGVRMVQGVFRKSGSLYWLCSWNLI